jgi:3-oxoacyl-[acyl-carrier protein] reductase
VTKRVLVTGASRGIGRAVALELAGAGFELGLNYRSDERAAGELAVRIGEGGGKTRLLRFDVSDADAARAALEEDVEAHGAYWGVVLNAGITADGPLATMKPAEWRSVLGTNLDAFYNVLQPLLMPMVRLRDGGRIVTMGSVSGVLGNRGQVNYSASKAGLIGATRALARELGKRAITVNCVSPGFIQTDMLAELPVEELAQTIPLRRLGRPEEVAALVGFLLSEKAGYITAQVLGIDGGMS